VNEYGFSVVGYISQGDVPRKDITGHSDVMYHSILKPKERPLTATPIFILTKYSICIFVCTSERIVPRTEYGLE
jgi:hypothetical protein